MSGEMNRNQISISRLAADFSCLASWLAILSATPAGHTE